MTDLDPFDEFEFKPLTEGLGFHKKSIKLKDQVQKAGLAQESLPRSFPPSPPEDSELSPEASPRQTLEQILMSLERPQPRPKAPSTPSPSPARASSSSVSVTQPLPREREKSQQTLGVASASMDPVPAIQPPLDFPLPGAPVLPETPTKPARVEPPQPDVGVRRGAADAPVSRLEPISMSFSSALLDLIAVVAVSMVFMMLLLTVTEVSLASVFASAQTDLAVQVSLGVLFLAVMQMYVVICRSFFGRTLGEWTFDLQMGSDEQHEKSAYPLRILWRSFLVLATGVFLLPLLSFLFRKDLLAPLTGLQLYRQRI